MPSTRSTTCCRPARPSPRRTRSASSTAISSRRTSSSPRGADGSADGQGARLRHLQGLVGTARRAGDASLTKTATVIGSPLYMSPEQMRPRATSTPAPTSGRSASILYELLTGKAPFERRHHARDLRGDPPREAAAAPRAPARSARTSSSGSSIAASRRTRRERYANVAELALALLPYGPRASRPSVERASRVMRRAGATIASVPPPPGEDEPPPSDPIPLRVTLNRSERAVNAGATTNLAPVLVAAASTRTSWGRPEGDARPRSRKRALALALVIGGAVAAAGFALIRSNRSATVTATSTLGTAAAKPEPVPALTGVAASTSIPIPTATPAREPDGLRRCARRSQRHGLGGRSHRLHRRARRLRSQAFRQAPPPCPRRHQQARSTSARGSR